MKEIFNILHIFSRVCDHCERSFGTEQGLKNHQSRKDANHFACHRVQEVQSRQAAYEKNLDRQNTVSSIKFGRVLPDVSEGPHQSGSIIHQNENM